MAHPDEIFLQKKLKDVFNIYFSSTFFVEELEKIKETEHAYYYERYRDMSTEFIKNILLE